MPLSISTNIAAEKANYYLGYNTDKMQESIKRLASGKRLTSPVQDPQSLGIHEIKCRDQSDWWSNEQCPERNLLFRGTGWDAGNCWQDTGSDE